MRMSLQQEILNGDKSGDKKSTKFKKMIVEYLAEHEFWPKKGDFLDDVTNVAELLKALESR